MEQFIIAVLSVALAAGIVAIRQLKKSVDAYSAEKGKNLAQKEDVEALTRIVEDVKQQNAVLLEDHKSRNQLRLAAIDRRLQAHQEAYSLWRRCVANAYGDPIELGKVVMQSQHWWNDNCLYLAPAARDAFFHSFMAVNGHKGMVAGGVEAATIRQNWEIVKKAGEVIVQSVALPVITDADRPSDATP